MSNTTPTTTAATAAATAAVEALIKTLQDERRKVMGSPVGSEGRDTYARLTVKIQEARNAHLMLVGLGRFAKL